jgi:hypothetical protein
MAYSPTLPDGVSLPPGFSVNTSDPRYRAVEAMATRENLSQRAFSEILGAEASRINSEYERARSTPAPAPAPAPVAKPYDQMSTAEKFAHALARDPAPPQGSNFR